MVMQNMVILLIMPSNVPRAYEWAELLDISLGKGYWFQYIKDLEYLYTRYTFVQ